MRTLALLALVLLLPPAAAQFSVTAPAEKVGVGLVVGPQSFSFRLEGKGDPSLSASDPWFLAGHDNVVNFTIFNGRDTEYRLNFTLNVTGAASSAETVAFAIPPYGTQTRTFTVHPDDVGNVEVVAESTDAFMPDGSPLRQSIVGPALLPPSVAFIDPPPRGEDDEFDTLSMFGGSSSMATAYLRVPPGESVRPRLEVRNPLTVATQPFHLSLVGSRNVGPVDVPSLEPGESRIVELPEFVAGDAPPGGGRFFGIVGRVDLRAVGEFTVGGATVTATLAQYRVERGAVQDLLPSYAVVDVQDGLSIDVLVPRDPRLGVPTRVKLNASNTGRDRLEGSLLVTLMTPNGLYYEVQGPESRTMRLDLGPGERSSETIEFTPRVTGQWFVSSTFRSSEGFGYGGGGGGFEVKGPVRIAFDHYDVQYVRIGEPVTLDITVASEATLQDAKLRVASGAGYRSYSDAATESGKARPGLTQRLLHVETSTASLGTLRPGGVVNASLQVEGRSSGRFDVIPYVLAEGFAYTSRPYDPARDGPIQPGYGGGIGMQVAVQTRAVPPALGLAPLTVGLAVFVGAWTLRTRFVK